MKIKKLLKGYGPLKYTTMVSYIGFDFERWYTENRPPPRSRSEHKDYELLKECGYDYVTYPVKGIRFRFNNLFVPTNEVLLYTKNRRGSMWSKHEKSELLKDYFKWVKERSLHHGRSYNSITHMIARLTNDEL